MSNADRPKQIVPDSATFGKHLSFMGCTSAFAQEDGRSLRVHHKRTLWEIEGSVGECLAEQRIRMSQDVAPASQVQT
jgi:hypothetical protein